MYGMVGSGGGGGGSKRERSMSKRSRRSFNQYRQSSTMSMTERGSKTSFGRTGSCSSGRDNRSTSNAVLNRSATVIGNRSTDRTMNLVGHDNEIKKETRLDTVEKGGGEEGLSETEGEKAPKSHHHGTSRRRRSRRSFYRRFLTMIKQAWTGVKFGSDSEEDEIEQEPRHRPENINALCKSTHFTRTELQRLYRAFKDRCPTGVITESTFKEIYCQMFPKGASASQYAHYVFLTLDSHGEGIINFEDLITLLSRLCRGSLGDRLCWIFSLYDLNHDGFISRSEMMEVVQAVYDLLGTETTVPVDGRTVEQKVAFLFETFDTNKDDVISLEEFIDACTKDLTLVQNLDAMANSILINDSQL